MGKFIISKQTNGEYQFNLAAGNGQTILTSEGYSAKSGCENGIESVRKNAGQDSSFEIRTAADGKTYFVVKATNGEIIGSSQMYADDSSCMNGIISVKNNAPDATVEDNTGN